MDLELQEQELIDLELELFEISKELKKDDISLAEGYYKHTIGIVYYFPLDDLIKSKF